MNTSNHLRFSLLLTLLLFFSVDSVFCQSVRNGRLVFSSKASFEQTYLRLSAELAAYVEPEGEPAEGVFFDPNPTLGAFESRLQGFVSLRSLALTEEYNQLRAGRSPEGLVDRSWVPDEVAESMLNGDYVVQVSDTIFYLLDKNTTVKILRANETVLSKILQGTPLGTLSNDIIVESRGGGANEVCVSEFTQSASFINTNSGQFTFSGSGVAAGTIYSWDFGDGTSSNQKNPFKTYASPGEYTVCLTIELEASFCYSFVCHTVKVNQNCQADFKYTKGGTPGLICFTDQSLAANATITDRTWDFGDGTTSNETNPCHTFLCDKNYAVKLSITASNGCRSESIRTVKVTSYACCDKDIDENETKFIIEVEPGKRRIKGSCEDFYILWGLWSNVNAELKHFKKGAFGWYWLKKSDLKAEIIGNVYTKDENDCICKTPYNVDCADQGHKSMVKAKKHIPAKFKTYKNDPWIAKFYEGGILRKTIVAPITCD